MFHKNIPEARAGLNVGMLLRGVDRDQVERGQVAILPGSMHPHREGTAEIFTLTAREGGRHTGFGSGYSPQLFFGACDATAVLDVGETGSVAPGDRATVRFKLGKPIAFEAGMKFAIREGGKTVGAGVVLATGA
jgi:elongation factor Tu